MTTLSFLKVAAIATGLERILSLQLHDGRRTIIRYQSLFFLLIYVQFIAAFVLLFPQPHPSYSSITAAESSYRNHQQPHLPILAALYISKQSTCLSCPRISKRRLSGLINVEMPQACGLLNQLVEYLEPKDSFRSTNIVSGPACYPFSTYIAMSLKSSVFKGQQTRPSQRGHRPTAVALLGCIANHSKAERK